MRRPIMLMTVLLALSGCVQATVSSRCSSNDSVRVGDEIVKANDWVKMQSSYLGWLDCDDGAVAEGISDRVGRLFAIKFTDFLNGVNEKKLDGKFVAFAMKHIDASQDEGNLRTILENSKSCTTKDAKICKQLQIRAQAALDDL